MKIFVETERLILREIVSSDAEGFFELDSDPEVHRFLGNNPVKKIEQIHEVIKFIRQQYTGNGIGRWAVIEKHSGNFLGWTGLKWVTEPTNNYPNHYDLGYRLIRKYWGQGFATESAKASVEYGFNTLNLAEILASANKENTASRNVLEKTGFKYIETFDREGTPTDWFKITKPA